MHQWWISIPDYYTVLVLLCLFFVGAFLHQWSYAIHAFNSTIIALWWIRYAVYLFWIRIFNKLQRLWYFLRDNFWRHYGAVPLAIRYDADHGTSLYLLADSTIVEIKLAFQSAMQIIFIVVCDNYQIRKCKEKEIRAHIIHKLARRCRYRQTVYLCFSLRFCETPIEHVNQLSLHMNATFFF